MKIHRGKAKKFLFYKKISVFRCKFLVNVLDEII